jgi:hypothetical protein
MAQIGVIMGLEHAAKPGSQTSRPMSLSSGRMSGWSKRARLESE